MPSEELVQQILDMIKSIGEAAVTEGWPIVVKQVYVDATGNAFIVLFFLVVIIVGSILNIKGARINSNNATKKESYCQEEYGPEYYWIGLIVLLCGVIGVLVFGFQVAARLINPEWYAVRMLLQFLQPSSF